MFLVTIGIINNYDTIKNYIINEIDLSNKEGFDIIIEEQNVGGTCYIKCGIRDSFLSRLVDKKTYDEFKFYIARILTKTIIDNWEEKIIKKIIKSDYFYLSEPERNAICERTLKFLQNEDIIRQQEGFYTIDRKTKLMRSILEYLNTEDTIILDGFVSFRVGSYIKDIKESIEKAVEGFVAEKEYNEFIKLLKYFVDIQECKIDIVHINPDGDSGYQLFDDKRNRINCDYFEDLKSELSDSNINNDDLLISTLITIAPNKIYLHNIEGYKNRELVQTIKNVFSDRTYICNGCELCNVIKISKEYK